MRRDDSALLVVLSLRLVLINNLPHMESSANRMSFSSATTSEAKGGVGLKNGTRTIERGGKGDRVSVLVCIYHWI
jgi:hypothetical protein